MESLRLEDHQLEGMMEEVHTKKIDIKIIMNETNTIIIEVIQDLNTNNKKNIIMTTNKNTLTMKSKSITVIISMKEDMINMMSHHKEVEVLEDGVSNLIRN